MDDDQAEALARLADAAAHGAITADLAALEGCDLLLMLVDRDTGRPAGLAMYRKRDTEPKQP